MKKLVRLLPRQKSILGAIAAGLVAYKHFTKCIKFLIWNNYWVWNFFLEVFVSNYETNAGDRECGLK